MCICFNMHKFTTISITINDQTGPYVDFWIFIFSWFLFPCVLHLVRCRSICTVVNFQSLDFDMTTWWLSHVERANLALPLYLFSSQSRLSYCVKHFSLQFTFFYISLICANPLCSISSINYYNLSRECTSSMLALSWYSDYIVN